MSLTFFVVVILCSRCVREKSDYKIVIDVRDNDVLGFDRLGYVKVSTTELRKVQKVGYVVIHHDMTG